MENACSSTSSLLRRPSAERTGRHGGNRVSTLKVLRIRGAGPHGRLFHREKKGSFDSKFLPSLQLWEGYVCISELDPDQRDPGLCSHPPERGPALTTTSETGLATCLVLAGLG